MRRLRVALKEKNSCEETLELEANTDCSVFIPPTSPGFISHLRVCWCAEREAASAAGGDKARCCGCGGGWSCLPVAEGALSSLQAAALHCVPRCCVNTRPESPASCTRTRGHQLNMHAHLKRFSHFLKQLSHLFFPPVSLSFHASVTLLQKYIHTHAYSLCDTNTLPLQPIFLFFSPHLISHYMLPKDTHGTPRCSFYPATSLGSCISYYLDLTGGPFHSTPNLIILANASITLP